MRSKLTWLVVTILLLTLCAGLAACGSSTTQNNSNSDASSKESDSSSDAASGGSSTQSEKPHGVSINLSDDSILTFDGNEASAKLAEDMRDGKTPKSCTVLYDQMGTLPSVTVNDARTIRDVYKKLARMHVEGESNMSVTDSYHLVSFELQDGTTASYRFEGEDILVRQEQNYAVSDQGELWPYVRKLQEEYLREQSAGSDYLAINLEDDDEMVEQCPRSAPAGEVVQVNVYTVEDAERHVAVNGDENFGEFVNGYTYEFVMPETPVTVKVWITGYDFGS